MAKFEELTYSEQTHYDTIVSNCKTCNGNLCANQLHGYTAEIVVDNTTMKKRVSRYKCRYYCKFNNCGGNNE